MTVDLQFTSVALPDHTFLVSAMQGKEALGAAFRFDIEVTCSDPALPLDDIIGASASLSVAARRIHGVISEVTQAGQRDGGFTYHVVLVPRLWLLSLGKISRVYQNLTTPEIVAAVLASTDAGVVVEERLEGHYGRRDSVMQYAESPLCFLSRLLEDEGITFRTASDEHGERLVLSDNNAAFDEREEASMDASGGLVLETFSCRRQLLPRRVLLQDHDPVRPDLPLHALAEVDAKGFGIDVLHGAGFRSPERGAAMAMLRAEALRGEGTRYEGSCHRPLAAGKRLSLTAHFRADFDGDYVLASVRHIFDADGYRCRFEAQAAQQPFRPVAHTPRPRIDGVLAARIDACGENETSAADALGQYRVVLPMDASGAREGGGSGPVPLLSPDEGTRLNLRRGAPVVLSFLGGDPDRPVIHGAVPPARARNPSATNVMRTPQGGIIEMSGKFARPPKGEARTAHGELVREQQQSGGNDWTTSNDDNADNDWVRFAVPHDGGWSYLRYGAQTTTTVAAGIGEDTPREFAEQTYVNGAHTYNSKFIDDDGETVRGGNTGYAWKWDDLNSSDFDTNLSGSIRSQGSYSYFGHAASQGVYDYTDGNRTVITQGSQQTVTVGHRTDVVLGDYRLIIPRRTSGVFDADVYGMRYRKQGGNWRKTEWSHVASDTYAWGDTESFFWGTSFALSGGVSAEGFLGGKLEAAVALSASVTLGASVEASIGDRFVYTKGDERTSSNTHLVAAKRTITFAIGEQSWSTGWVTPVFGAAAGVLAVAGAVGSIVSFDEDNPNTSLISSAVLGGLAIVAGGVVAAKLLVDDATDPEGYPRMVMNGDDGIKIEASEDNTLLLDDNGLLIKIGGDDGCTLQITANGVFLKSKGHAALLLDSVGAGGITSDGNNLTADSTLDDMKMPAVAVDAEAAVLAFDDDVAFFAEAGSAEVCQ